MTHSFLFFFDWHVTEIFADMPERNFLFPFAFREAPFCHRILTGQQVREMVRSSPEQSIMIALQRFNNVLRCIRRRLASPDLNMALSDDTIVAIIDSICYNASISLPYSSPFKLNLLASLLWKT